MDWQTLLDRLHDKVLAVTARSMHKIPYTTEKGVFDDLSESNISWWTNGFWAGLLWQFYGAYGDEILRKAAEEVEGKLDKVFLLPQGMDHDSGFRWLPTAGANYTLTGSEDSRRRLQLAANDDRKGSQVRAAQTYKKKTGNNLFPVNCWWTIQDSNL